MPFSVRWYTLLNHAEDFPPGATLVTPLSRKRFRITDTQEHRVIIEFTDSGDARPLQHDQFETLYQHIRKADSCFDLNRIPSDAEPYAAVLTLHPRYEIDADAGIIRETDELTATQVLDAGGPAGTGTPEEADRFEPDLNVYDDAPLLIDDLDRLNLTDLADLETPHLISLVTLLSDVQCSANGLRKDVREVLLNRLHHNRPIHRQYGSVQRTIHRQERKDLGEVYTPQIIARLIVHASMNSSDDIVLDPAVGTGMFLVEAYDWLNDHNGMTHQQVVDQIAGVDVNRSAAHFAVINLARQNLDAKTERTNIHVEDFFDIGPEQHLLSTETADIDEGDEDSDKTAGKMFADVNVIVGNPPYINRNEIDDKDAKRDHLPSKYATYGEDYISKKSDIYQYFFTKGLEWLDDGGRLGYLTSYKWTTIKSGEGLMNYFLNNAKIKGIIWFNKALFEDAMVNTCVTLLEKQGGDDPDNKKERAENIVPFFRLEEKRPISEILDLLDSDISHEGDNYRVICRKQSELANEKKWSRFLIAPTEYFKLVQHDKITTLPEICQTEGYLTGIKTQCDDFFKVDENTVEKYEIPDEYLTSGLMTKRDIEDGAFLFTADDTEEYFIDLHDIVLDVIDESESSPIVSEDGEVKASNKVDTIQRLVFERLRNDGHDKFTDYIKEKGEKHDYPPKNKDGSHDLSHTIYRRGEAWFDLDVLETPELVIPETRKHNPGVMWNVDKLAVKDIGRPVYLTAGGEMLMGGIMNSAIGRLFIESHGRISGGQAIRVMVYDMKTLPVVDPRELDEEEAERIRNAFDDWITDPSNTEYNDELDEAVLSTLGWEDRVEEIQYIAERMKNIRSESANTRS